ncbi:hypothetical protein TELCIR_20186 [Teladorsagia circumcincta]|uniref:Uncharacterized protein n=1 Tax=Teladorsagia circumcincta TaxID=45464 RepID=A0A2G9TM16_TELCI|nr:hypothetical protein TELCIR_20186 [Teladorsagia circumcincta]
MYSMGFGFLCFGLVKTKYWIGPIKSLYFVGFVIFFIVWPIVHYILKQTLPRKPKAGKETESVPANGISKKEL